MAPLVVKGKVLVGNSGGEMGVRGWLKALDASTGKVAWRAYSTGPDKDVLIGPRFKPFYAKDRGQGPRRARPGRRDAWKIGGGTVWGWISYDPELDLDLLRHRQSRAVESGAASRRQQVDRRRMFARDPETGEAVWAYQMAPHDLHDYDGDQREHAARPADRRAQTRKVLVRPERNGYVYVMDRATGEVLSAEPFGYINSTTRRRSEDGPLRYDRREGAASRARSCATSVPPRPA